MFDYTEKYPIVFFTKSISGAYSAGVYILDKDQKKHYLNDNVPLAHIKFLEKNILTSLTSSYIVSKELMHKHLPDNISDHNVVKFSIKFSDIGDEALFVLYTNDGIYID